MSGDTAGTRAIAGWYMQADGQQRYWDGAQWTDHFAPGPATAVPRVETAPEKKRRGCLFWFLTAAAAFVVLVVIIAVASSGGSPTTAASPPTSARTSGSSMTTPPNVAVKPTAKPVLLTPEQAITAAATKAGLDQVNVMHTADGTPNGWVVQFAVKDNLTGGLIKGGAAEDIYAATKAVRDARAQYGLLHFVGMFPMTDSYGNTSVDPVLTIDLAPATVAQINFDGVDRTSLDNLCQIADSCWVSPGLK